MCDRAPDGTAFAVAGQTGRDAPVAVLIHGLGLSSDWMAGLADDLGTSHRVVTYDLDGHGRSEPMGARTLGDLAAQLVRLLDRLDIRQAALVGFSLGGMINRRVALDRPERVTSLVILNSPHERDPATQARVEREAADAAAGGPEATIDAALARWFTEGFRRRDRETVARVRAQVLGTDPGSYARCRAVLAGGVTELIRPPSPIGLPTLVMTSQDDTGSTPAMARAIADGIAGARVQVVPGLRHLGLVERPAAFANPVHAFLNGADAGVV